MKNIWSVLCGKAVVDQMSNSLSMQDVIDEVTISFAKPEDMQMETKNIPVSMMVVNLWYDENTQEERTLDYVIEVYDPKNKKMGEFPISAKFDAKRKRLRTIANISGLKLSNEGLYSFRTSFKDKQGNLLQVAEVPIDIKFVLNMRRDGANPSPNTNKAV